MWTCLSRNHSVSCQCFLSLQRFKIIIIKFKMSNRIPRVSESACKYALRRWNHNKFLVQRVFVWIWISVTNSGNIGLNIPHVSPYYDTCLGVSIRHVSPISHVDRPCYSPSLSSLRPHFPCRAKLRCQDYLAAAISIQQWILRQKTGRIKYFELASIQCASQTLYS